MRADAAGATRPPSCRSGPGQIKAAASPIVSDRARAPDRSIDISAAQQDKAERARREEGEPRSAVSSGPNIVDHRRTVVMQVLVEGPGRRARLVTGRLISVAGRQAIPAASLIRSQTCWPKIES